MQSSLAAVAIIVVKLKQLEDLSQGSLQLTNKT